MFAFLWILAAMGVGYAAKIQGRRPWFWFALSVLISPLGGSVALWAWGRFGLRI